MLILYHLLTLQKRRRKRPCHPRRVLLPTRIYLAGFMTRGLPLRKRDYAHRHDSARASLRNVDCLHKAMGARAQRGARRKGTFFFFSCYIRLPPCNVITGVRGPRTRGGRPWMAWRLAEGNSEPGRWSLRWRRCTGVGSSWLPGSWVTADNASREGKGKGRGGRRPVAVILAFQSHVY